MSSNLYNIKQKLKKIFLAWQYQSLNTSEIDQYHESIMSAQPQESDCNKSLKNQFNNPNFWSVLKEGSGFSNDVEQLETQWQAVKEFADFNAQELMSLKRRVFDYYDVVITRALEELESDLKRYELNGIWRPRWILELHKEKIAQLQEKTKVFDAYEKKLQSTLAIKSTMHTSLGTQKHVDDIYLYFVKQLNQLNLLKIPLLAPLNPSCYLDDDTRVAIHDYLDHQGVLSNRELDSIIVPISQSPFNVPVRPNQASQESIHIEQFAVEIERRLQLTSVEKYKKEKKEIDTTKIWLINRVVKPLSRYIASTELIKSAMNIWRYRWVLALIASMGLYVCLASAATGFVTLTVGAWATNIATNILFYGIALFPAYVMGAKGLNALGNKIFEKLSYWKSREIQQSLELLKQNQRFVSSQLSSGISDIALFDIAGLSTDAKAIMKNIDHMVHMLEKTQGGARFVYWGDFKASHLEVIDELKKQKQLIESRLSTYSGHICERLEESLINLRIDICNGKLKPSIPKGQIESLYNFVEEHGAGESLNQFQKSTNVPALFASALLKDNTFLQRTMIKPSLNQPWGGSKSNRPSYRGWETLIEHYTMDQVQRNAALNIVGVLTGKRVCTLSALGKWVATVAPSHVKVLMQNIQQHIFLTLDSQPAAHARLLSSSQKRLIKSWSSANDSAIKEALVFVRDLNSPSKHFAAQEQSCLVKHFEALEGLDRLQALQGQTGGGNDILIALEKYNGKSSSAIYLLKFLPENIKPIFTARVATQRLNRLISHLINKEGEVFTDEDTLLFNLLVKCPEAKNKFNLTNQIRGHAKYKEPWTKKFSYFLSQCTEYGLNDGSLEDDYESLNKRIKEFTQQLSKTFVSSCSSESINTKNTNNLDVNTSTQQPGRMRCA
tara:strand:- start:12051 stop:14738 length:2688 start_codon:yes stop_codon:yes gene_type:complete